MQYRRLSIEELQSLESEFVKYLSLQGIDAISWESLKNSDTSKCDELIDDFSKFIFDSTLEKIKYLIKSENDVIFIFEMQNDCGRLFIFKVKGAIHDIVDITSQNVEFLSVVEKKYTSSRNMEIFRMLESGCNICTLQVFNELIKLVII